jgi:F-type H+-transporting ATPase subunit delta
MGAHSLATRYAKSLIELAQEKGSLDRVFADMKSINSVFESSRDLKLMFKSPIITADKKLNVARQLFEGKIDGILYQFIVLVIKKGREAYLSEIAHAFVEQYNVIKNITPVTLTSAVKLDTGLVQSMLAALKSKEKLGDVELKEVIDESLIGGFVLQYGDKMIDSSVKTNLSLLRDIIEDNTYIKKYS